MFLGISHNGMNGIPSSDCFQAGPAYFIGWQPRIITSSQWPWEVLHTLDQMISYADAGTLEGPWWHGVVALGLWF